MTPHTLLLIPPPGSDLLADEPGGGRVPWLWLRPATVGYGGHGKRPATDLPGRWCLPNSLSSQPTSFRATATDALLLILDGAPVPMGIDRAARRLTALTVERVRREGTGTIRAFAPQSEYRIERAAPMQPYGILDLCDAWEAEGARVVALGADGREVS